MATLNGSHAPDKPKGKYAAMIVCWLLGIGCLFSWNSMLTIEDYYVYIFPHYHPSRVLTLVYQPFALGTMAVLAYNEAKINTRLRNLSGYALFFLSTLYGFSIGSSYIGEKEVLELSLEFVQLVVLLESQMRMFRAGWLVTCLSCSLHLFSLSLLV
ncbi:EQUILIBRATIVE NUCLEOSIDE TRANSPORTER [Salix koriyanagi]|uniref:EQUILIBRATIVE NUCLEOSIDE TRANSPORTER n=1 Tax=Salix koriyanagi TaxID=2511006 RepID=A0A9Q0WA11_9ROSI|nr:EQUILIBRATIVE NUCLEOSIDE TRANSPORTER [Salix koriyanagi]